MGLIGLYFIDKQYKNGYCVFSIADNQVQPWPSSSDCVYIIWNVYSMDYDMNLRCGIFIG